MKKCKLSRKLTVQVDDQCLKRKWPVRLRGGAKVPGCKDLPNMKDRAVLNAKVHGICIRPGVENLGNGNCAFETVLDSINTRECFLDKLRGSPDEFRHKWMSVVENLAYENWNGGLSRAEWNQGWAVLKQSGTYEYKLGDLVLPGIAHCTRKDILIFNTIKMHIIQSM